MVMIIITLRRLWSPLWYNTYEGPPPQSYFPDLESPKMEKRRRSLLDKKQSNSCTSRWVLYFDYKWAWWYWLQRWGHGWWITFSNVNWMNLSRKQHFESFRSCLELNLKWKSFAELLLEMKMPMFQQLILSSGVQGADLNQHGPVQGKPQRANCLHRRRPWRRWCLGIVRLMVKCQIICFLVDMKAKEE